MGVNPYIKIEKVKLNKLRGDPSAMFWYSVIADYSKRFPIDKHGYFRIAKKTIKEDYGFSRDQVKYLDKKLVKAGVIIIDKKKGGGRTPAGYKIL